MNHRAQFTVIERDGVILVEYLDQGRSVTNDAEHVIADLARRGFDLTQPVIYRDTTGRWDGICVRNGVCSGFYSLAPNLSDALAALVKMRRMRDGRLGDVVPPLNHAKFDGMDARPLRSGEG